MYLDSHNAFSDADAVTATAISENVIDLVTDRIGAGKRLEVSLSVETTFVSAALDGTLTVALLTSDAVAFGTSDTLWTMTAVAEASLVEGYVFDCPPIPDKTERYLALYYTVGGSGNFTAGKLDGFIAEAKQSNNYDTMKKFIS